MVLGGKGKDMRKFDPLSRAIDKDPKLKFDRVDLIHEDQLIDPNCTFTLTPVEAYQEAAQGEVVTEVPGCFPESPHGTPEPYKYENRPGAPVEAAKWDDEFVHSSAKVEQYGKWVRVGLTRCGEESRRRRVSGNPAELTCLSCKGLLAMDGAVKNLPDSARVDYLGLIGNSENEESITIAGEKYILVEEPAVPVPATVPEAVAAWITDGTFQDDEITGYPNHYIVNGDHSGCFCGGELPPATSEEGLSAEDLDGMEAGDEVMDDDGDIWEKNPDGTWNTELVKKVNGNTVSGTPSAVVVAVCGPIRSVPATYIGNARRKAVREILENREEQEAVAAQHKDCCGEPEQ